MVMRIGERMGKRMESGTIEVEWLKEDLEEAYIEKEAAENRKNETGAGREQEAPEPKHMERSGKTESGQKKILNGPEFAQVREAGRTYLLCAGGVVCRDEEAMLADNRPDGLLPMVSKCVDGQMQLSYDITGRQSLSGCYGKKAIAYGDLCTMLLSVHCCLNRMEEYLLSEDNLVFCPANLYTNMAGKQLYFVYLPSLDGSFSEHIREFAQFLMEHVDYQDDRAVGLAGQFYKYAEAENFSMTVFLEENRIYFEEADTRKEQDERAAGESSEEWHIREGSWPEQTAEERQEKGMQLALVVLAAAAAAGLAAWSLPWNARTLIPVGICAGIAAGVLFWYNSRAKRLLIKKEREIFFIEDHSSSGEAASDG